MCCGAVLVQIVVSPQVTMLVLKWSVCTWMQANHRRRDDRILNGQAMSWLRRHSVHRDSSCMHSYEPMAQHWWSVVSERLSSSCVYGDGRGRCYTAGNFEQTNIRFWILEVTCTHKTMETANGSRGVRRKNKIAGSVRRSIFGRSSRSSLFLLASCRIPLLLP
jgi:hypothetical protein